MRARRWMAGLVGVVSVVVCVGGARLAGGEQRVGDVPAELEALEHGALVVWVVRAAPAGTGGRGTRIQGVQVAGVKGPDPMDYKESTAGSFGKSASDYGTASSNVGMATTDARIGTQSSAPGANAPAGSGYKEQTAGTFGQTSSSVGTVASDHGQTAGSLGTASSNVGQTAGSYGQTAGSLGQTAGSYGQAASTVGQAGSGAARPVVDALQRDIDGRLKVDYPEVQVQYVAVRADELKDRLTAAEGTGGYPDVLVGDLPAAWWGGLQERFGVAGVYPAGFYADGVSGTMPSLPQIAILARAQHKEAARAFTIWLDEMGACAGCVQAGLGKETEAAAGVAVSAVKLLLEGEGVGEMADAAMAEFSGQMGRGMLVATASGGVDESAIRVEVVRAAVNGGLATVAVRVVASSEKVFGVAHPLVVLRKGEGGQWRVLHVSLNLAAAAQKNVEAALMDTEAMTAQQRRAGVLGVSVAAPTDGETRGPMPELWWDNGGAARLQVVEWQMMSNAGWTDARLYLVPDKNSRVQTRVRAGFASAPGAYRWRVWSVGMEGETKISGWRVVKVVR